MMIDLGVYMRGGNEEVEKGRVIGGVINGDGVYGANRRRRTYYFDRLANAALISLRLPLGYEALSSSSCMPGCMSACVYGSVLRQSVGVVGMEDR